MLAHLIAFGFFAAEPPPAGVGEIEAVAEYTVSPRKVPALTVGAGDIPRGAYYWPAPFDPSDRRPYVYDWSLHLADDERVAAIARITMSAAGAALGVIIDETSDRAPIISTDGKLTQVYFQVLEEYQQNPAFNGAGVPVAVSMLVRTDASPFNDYERTAVLTVRNL